MSDIQGISISIDWHTQSVIDDQKSTLLTCRTIGPRDKREDDEFYHRDKPAQGSIPPVLLHSNSQALSSVRPVHPRSSSCERMLPFIGLTFSPRSRSRRDAAGPRRTQHGLRARRRRRS